MLDEFMSGDSYVLEVRLDAFPDYAMVRCAPKRPLAFMDAMGKWALLHGPRDESRTGYFGVARIDSFELHPRGSSTLVFLDEVEIFDTPVSTVLHDGRPRENAPEDLNGNLAFSFYSDGLRPISDERFDAILEAAGHGRALTMGELGETTPSDHPPTVPYRPDLSPEDRVIEGYKIEQRRIRAKLRAQLVRGGGGAFCCMSGASFDLPDSFSLLQLGHFWPLGHHGPDVLTNVGFMTGNIHPIYENGLVTIRADHSFRFAPDIPPGFLAEFRDRTQLTISGNLALDPAEENLAYHREEIFLRRLKVRGISTADRGFA